MVVERGRLVLRFENGFKALVATQGAEALALAADLLELDLAGHDAATGKEKWRFKTGEDPDIHNQVGIQSGWMSGEKKGER